MQLQQLKSPPAEATVRPVVVAEVTAVEAAVAEGVDDTQGTNLSIIHPILLQICTY